jgi:cyclophilin family peptidyl-prolyl cis-trans isomerase
MWNAKPAEPAEKCFLCVLCALCVLLVVARAQDEPASPRTTRLAVLQAEDRRAPTARDLAIIRAGAHGPDAQTVRVAIRALGRLERPALIPDITPSLRNALPEIRSEAANAIGQAAHGWKSDHPPDASALDAVSAPLAARLKIEADPDVREALCETIGRLPYVTAMQVEAAERTLLETAARGDSVIDRLGVAKGFEALVRIHRKLHAPGDEALARLRHLATPGPGEALTGARVRRLALEALISAAAVDDEVMRAASRDPDTQVRRIAMHAAATGGRGGTAESTARAALSAGRADDSPSVRLEALRGLQPREDTEACAAALAAIGDRDPHVALFALDELGECSAVPDVVAALERAVNDLSDAGSARGWHRAAHALVALAAAAPARGAAVLPQFTRSRIWQLRMYAARAAALLKDQEALEVLARDEDDNVRETAVEGLRKLTGHDADAIYVSQLSRNGNQILRVAALALEGTAHPEQAVPALQAAWQRLSAEGRDNSHDARDAIARALTSVGADPRVGPGSRDAAGRTRGSAPTQPTDLNADDLRRLAAPRARVTIRSVGTFDLALFTSQAPAAVLRFARLAESGYYNGLTFHRVVPNFVIQGGSPGASEYIGDAGFMRDEVGLWPHVRGAVGISTRGHDTGDAQIFIDLVDNPRLDHEYTVFAQVLNGIEIVDQVLEGDVIERIEIVVGP